MNDLGDEGRQPGPIMIASSVAMIIVMVVTAGLHLLFDESLSMPASLASFFGLAVFSVFCGVAFYAMYQDWLCWQEGRHPGARGLVNCGGLYEAALEQVEQSEASLAAWNDAIGRKL